VKNTYNALKSGGACMIDSPWWGCVPGYVTYLHFGK